MVFDDCVASDFIKTQKKIVKKVDQTLKAEHLLHNENNSKSCVDMFDMSERNFGIIILSKV